LVSRVCELQGCWFGKAPTWGGFPDKPHFRSKTTRFVPEPPRSQSSLVCHENWIQTTASLVSRIGVSCRVVWFGEAPQTRGLSVESVVY
jgi:hypothetical protein